MAAQIKFSAIKLAEAGYNQALYGLALNKKQKLEDMSTVALKLASKDGGHNKFLEHIMTWWSVRAPRYWWQEADTFRLASKQSESTMHTLVRDLNKGIDLKAFENPDLLSADQIADIEHTLAIKDETEKLIILKQVLPESFMQEREWILSYKTLRNIMLQRMAHRFPHWRIFVVEILRQVDHPELLPHPDQDSREYINNALGGQAYDTVTKR